MTRQGALRRFIANRMDDDPDLCVIVQEGDYADIYAPSWADVVGVELWQNKEGWQVDFLGEGLVQFEPSPEQAAMIQSQAL